MLKGWTPALLPFESFQPLVFFSSRFSLVFLGARRDPHIARFIRFSLISDIHGSLFTFSARSKLTSYWDFWWVGFNPSSTAFHLQFICTVTQPTSVLYACQVWRTILESDGIFLVRIGISIVRREKSACTLIVRCGQVRGYTVHN